MAKKEQSDPLRTLALAGSLRPGHDEVDREWLKTITECGEPGFSALDDSAHGVRVAWRNEGTAPEPVTRGYSSSGAEQILLAGRSEAPTESAKTWLDQLDPENADTLRTVKGPCVVFAWSETTGRRLLFRPAGGQRTLSYAPVEQGVLFASNSSCLARHPEVDGHLNWQAVAEQLTYGNIFGEKTLFQGIRRMEPGAGLWQSGSHTKAVQTEWKNERLPDSPHAQIDKIDEALHRAVAAAWEGAENPALCLSAGLDSRTLMAVAHRQGIPLACVTNGIEGSVELRLAERMCNTIGAEHLRCLLEKDMVDQVLEGAADVVEYTDGEGTIQSTNMLHIARQYEERLGLDRVIRGIGGELLKLSSAYSYAIPRDLERTADESEVQKHLLSQLALPQSPEQHQCLRGELKEVLETGADEGFIESWNALRPHQATPVQKASLLFLRAYIGRATADSMRILRQSVDLSQPFLNEDFLEILMASSIELRMDSALQIELIRRNAPELLKIPNSDIRAPLNAGRLRKQLATFHRRLARRLGFGEIDVPEKWLMARLDGFFKTTLLEEQALSRAHIDADAMRSFLSGDHSREDHARAFLGRLATLELHLRNQEFERTPEV